MTESTGAPTEYIILDACCVINLYASGRMGEILLAYNARFAIPSYVLENETLRVYSGFSGHGTDDTEEISLDDLIKVGVVEVVYRREDSEIETFVEYSASLDDGEATVGAIAASREWGIATDDKKAISYFSESIPQIPLVSTLQLVKNWADILEPSDSELKEVLQGVALGARYRPGSEHNLYEWWQNAGGSELADQSTGDSS